MLTNLKPAECQVCYSAESRGVHSKRQQENLKWPATSDLRVRYLDLRFNSNCNLKCVTCSAAESSLWKQDNKKYFLKAKNHSLKKHFEKNLISNYDNNFELFFKEFEKVIADLHEIYFAGGEPLLQKEHFLCLEMLIKSGLSQNIRLVYNTNITLIDDELLKTWSRFKSVQVNASIDAVGGKNDYIRYPSSWRLISGKLNLLDHSEENISVRITMTISALNILSIPEVVIWKAQQNFKKIQTALAPGDVDLNILHFPSHLNVQIFNELDKKNIEKNISTLLDSSLVSDTFKIRLSGLIMYMNEKKIDASIGRSAFHEYLQILDEERNLDYKTIFPEVSELQLA
jgi:sulfatase maturation enzyme AslB (radical SAM superfamily)